MKKIGFNKSKELYCETLLSIEKLEFLESNFCEIEKIENEIQFENRKMDTSVGLKKKLSYDVKWYKYCNNIKCTFNSCHHGKLDEVNMKLWHICRVCQNKKKKKKFHRPNMDDCLLNKHKWLIHSIMLKNQTFVA